MSNLNGARSRGVSMHKTRVITRGIVAAGMATGTLVSVSPGIASAQSPNPKTLRRQVHQALRLLPLGSWRRQLER